MALACKSQRPPACLNTPVLLSGFICQLPNPTRRLVLRSLHPCFIVVVMIAAHLTLLVPQSAAQGELAKLNAPNDASTCESGEGFFDYGPVRANKEAEILAMVLSGQLRAPDALYERILRDLALIRSTYPVLETTVDDPNFVPDQLIVRLEDTEVVPGYDALNIFYQVIDDRVLSQSRNTHLLTFCDNLNAQALRWVYETLTGEVLYAEPNFIIGADDQITIFLLPQAYRYTIIHGFGDCPAGCKCLRRAVIDVQDDGTVVLVSYSDDGGSSCEFEDTVCCLPNGGCQAMAVGSCLNQNGIPQAFDATCGECPNLLIPTLSMWGMVLMGILTLTAATLILRRSPAVN